MEIVIDIPDTLYNTLQKNKGTDVELDFTDRLTLQCAAEDGIPLPKGHGRLIDVSDIEWAKHMEERDYIDYDVVDWDDIQKAPTIIKTDKAGEEE